MENKVLRYLKGVTVVIQGYLPGTPANAAGQQHLFSLAHHMCQMCFQGLEDHGMCWMLARDSQDGSLEHHGVRWVHSHFKPEYHSNILKGTRQKWGEPCTWDMQLWGEAEFQSFQKMGAEHWGWVRETRAKLLGYEVWERNCHNLAPLKELMAVTAVFASQTLLESFKQALRIKF